MHFSSHSLSDFSNVTALCAKGHELGDNHLAEETFRVYYLRSTVMSPLTIRFYTISSYTSCRQMDTWEIAWWDLLPPGRDTPDRYFICDVRSLAAINHFLSYEFLAKVLFDSCISTVYVRIISNRELCDKLFIRLT